MTYFSGSVQGKLQQAFAKNEIPLSVKSDHLIPQNPHDCSREKIERIVESAGFCPLVAPFKIGGNFAFTVSPYPIPDFFNPRDPKVTDKGEGLYFTGDELTELLTLHKFVLDKEEKVKDKWSAVNSYRSFVTPALSKGICELISKYAKAGCPMIEIGSGIGYSLEGLSNVIRTQQSQDECKLLYGSISEPVYKLDIHEIYNCLSKIKKKVPLFFAVDVFDTLSPELRKASFLQLAQLQNSGDRILLMLDTNPCYDVIIEHLESLHPNEFILPYCPLSSDPDKSAVIVVPKQYVEHSYLQGYIQWGWAKILIQESLAIRQGRASQMQYSLHELQRKFNLQVIILEDFFVEQVKNELKEVGYEVDIYYHNSFTCGDPPEGHPEINQDLLYKSVTDIFTVRQWCLTDKKLLNSLSQKNLTLPSHFNTEFLTSLREKHQKILGAEILVINAKKI